MKILIVDDERYIRESLKEILDFEGHTTAEAADGKEGLEAAMTGNFDAIFCDIKMPVMDGQEMLAKLVESGVDTPVIMISGHGTIEDVVKCIKMGAYDYIEKPLNDLNRILITLKNATDKTNLVKETKILRKKVEKVAGVPEIVGESEPIVRIKAMIDRVAATDARVLITGSNGTGKELVARWLHEKSNRNTMPFVEVNCAAIPGELIESELFGHVKGSFSGAIKDHKGKFEQADGGTLFLDEIGDMSLSAQAKVLRVLQENKITRVGSDKDINVKVRVVAATNKNLLDEISKGNFREDLYHRLSVIVIHVPALLERKEDIPLLVNHFINQICSEGGMPIRKIEPDAIEELKKHSWTGNIRELRNVTERLIILSNQTITKEDVVMYASPLFR
ncbi:MAG: sigma-54-dependent Fis family transcriptional regulator [Bacteroidales bacterium]|nr:sigma-54-dependent Fis family transcriptional regulator [Bacteroidales bacterium]